MALTIVTDVTEEPVTLDEQKAHLRLDTDDDDAYLSKCIIAARQWVEGQTKRAIMDQTWDLGIDYEWPCKYGVYRIDFPLNPIPTLTSPSTIIISYVDSNGDTQTLAETQYTVATRTHHSFIVPAYDVTWPTVRCVPDAITVRFQAGDSDNIPRDLHQAVMMLAGHYYENRETGVKAPEAVESMISPYRRAVFR